MYCKADTDETRRQKKKLTGKDDYRRMVQQGPPEVHDVFPVRCGFAKRKHDSLSYDCDYCADRRSVAGGGKGVFYNGRRGGSVPDDEDN